MSVVVSVSEWEAEGKVGGRVYRLNCKGQSAV